MSVDVTVEKRELNCTTLGALLLSLFLLFLLFPDYCLAQGSEKGKTTKAHRKLKGSYNVIEPLVDKSYMKLLTGGIKHSEKLPPLESKLKVGAEYDESKVEKPLPSRNWYKVPSWLVGTWESQTQTDVTLDKAGKRTVIGSIKNHGLAHYGVQRDRAGDVWDCVYVPLEVQNESVETINKDLTTSQVIVRNSEKLFVIKDVFVRRQIDKKSKKIIAASMMEQISSITSTGKDRIELLGSLKEFDLDGRTLSTMHATMTYLRTAALKVQKLDSNTHEDLEKSLNQYLKSNSLEKLMIRTSEGKRATQTDMKATNLKATGQKTTATKTSDLIAKNSKASPMRNKPTEEKNRIPTTSKGPSKND